ncbi:hypothetical protein M885DRAFT_539156 [Pelagophyceae sp. CCMP2097]|nr:hypothetical protein M885DRAFT_539156 [Pelagophyceae sp. CCMP2097]
MWKQYQADHDGGDSDFGRKAALKKQAREIEMSLWQRSVESMPAEDFERYLGGILVLDVHEALSLLERKAAAPFAPIRRDDPLEIGQIMAQHYKFVLVRGRLQEVMFDFQSARYVDATRSSVVITLGTRVYGPAVSKLRALNAHACASSWHQHIVPEALPDYAFRRDDSDASSGDEDDDAPRGPSSLVVNAIVTVEIREDGVAAFETAAVVVVKEDDSEPTYAPREGDGDDVGCFVVAGITAAGRPFVRHLRGVGEYKWPASAPSGVLQTQTRAHF